MMVSRVDYTDEIATPEERAALDTLVSLLPERIAARFSEARASTDFGTASSPVHDLPYRFAEPREAVDLDGTDADVVQHVTPFNSLVEVTASIRVADDGGDLFEYPTAHHLGADTRKRLRLLSMNSSLLKADEILTLTSDELGRREVNAARSSRRTSTQEVTLVQDEVKHADFVELCDPSQLHSPNIPFIQQQLTEILARHMESQVHCSLVHNGVIIGVLFLNTRGSHADSIVKATTEALNRARDGANGFNTGIRNVDYPCGHLVFWSRNDA